MATSPITIDAIWGAVDYDSLARACPEEPDDAVAFYEAQLVELERVIRRPDYSVDAIRIYCERVRRLSARVSEIVKPRSDARAATVHYA